MLAPCLTLHPRASLNVSFFPFQGHYDSSRIPEMPSILSSWNLSFAGFPMFFLGKFLFLHSSRHLREIHSRSTPPASTKLFLPFFSKKKASTHEIQDPISPSLPLTEARYRPLPTPRSYIRAERGKLPLRSFPFLFYLLDKNFHKVPPASSHVKWLAIASPPETPPRA